MDDAAEVTRDGLLAGRVSLIQPRRGHRAGTDAVLLAAMAAEVKAGRIVDVGAASGAIGLMLGKARPDADITFIEQDTFLADLCRENIENNGLSDRARVVASDIFDEDAMMHGDVAAGCADLVVSNPPFIEEGRARLSPDVRRRKAHALPKDGLKRWIGFCANLLQAKGTLALIHRTDKLVECLNAVPKDFGACRIRMIHPRRNEAATRVIVMATRCRKSPTLVEAPLFLHEADGSFTAEAKALHEGSWLVEAKEKGAETAP